MTVIQTDKNPTEFRSLVYNTQAVIVKHILEKTTDQGLLWKLYDGVAESQYRVTEVGNEYIYFIDNFGARGCFTSE